MSLLIEWWQHLSFSQCAAFLIVLVWCLYAMLRPRRSNSIRLKGIRTNPNPMFHRDWK